LPSLIEERVTLACRGDNTLVITRLKPGWPVIGDVRPLPFVERMRQYLAAR